MTLRGASGEPAGRSLCHLLSTQALQIYVIVSALCTRHPLLMSPVAFAHHLMTGAGMCISLRPFGHSRTGLFFGVTELSTIPLDVIDLFKGLKPSAASWPQAAISPLASPAPKAPAVAVCGAPKARAVAALHRLGRAPSAPPLAKFLHPGFKQLRTQFPRTELVSKITFALSFLGLRVGLVTHARWALSNPTHSQPQAAPPA